MPRDQVEERRVTAPGFDPKIEWARLRDGFAGRAMEALLHNVKLMHDLSEATGQPFGAFIGEKAYEIADGMMQARKRRGGA
jgi:hypothetical protein